MKTICCVCKITTKPDHNGDGLISHGYCNACFKDVMMDIEKLKQEIEDQKQPLSFQGGRKYDRFKMGCNRR